MNVERPKQMTEIQEKNGETLYRCERWCSIWEGMYLERVTEINDQRNEKKSDARGFHVSMEFPSNISHHEGECE